LSRTARGYHSFFKSPDERRVDGRVGLLPGLDVRGEGGYVVVPPSVHASGVQYEWLTPPDRQDLASLPRTVQALLGAPQPHSGNGTPGLRVSDVILAGARNSHLYSLARSLKVRGFSRDENLASVSSINERRCDPPLDESELAAIVDNAMTQPDRSDFITATRGTVTTGVSEAIGPVSGRAQLVHLADVRPQLVEWLWDGRIPRGKLTLLIGDPGAGKSTLSLDLVARVTTGREWPGPGGATAPLGNALLLSAEDGIADTLRPRVDQLRGDPERVWVLTAVRGGPGGERLFDIAQDISALEETIQKHDISIVVIDPVSAYLGKADSFKDAEVRRVLAPAAAMAERTGVTLIGVLHLTKDTDRRAIHRALGSIAFTAAPRAIFAVSKDDDDERRRFFLPVKLNLAAMPPVLAFRLSNGVLEWEPEPVEGVSADAVLSAAPDSGDAGERKTAVEFLREVMNSESLIKAVEVMKQARQLGISPRSLYRAKDMLRVESKRFDYGGPWFWCLSDAEIATAPAQTPDTPGNVAIYGSEADKNVVDSVTSSSIASARDVATFGGNLRKRRVIPWHLID
jgi:AAA domain/Bifunctional DNA primase/polymerase, N-terminal/Primase C terminal 1 (PriCT-1)